MSHCVFFPGLNSLRRSGWLQTDRLDSPAPISQVLYLKMMLMASPWLLLNSSFWCGIGTPSTHPFGQLLENIDKVYI